MNVLRVWDEARTSHFELMEAMTPAEMVYRTENYSFDSEKAKGIGARKLGRFATSRLILTGDWDVVELNEPTMVKLWPILSLYILAFKSRPLIGRRPGRLVLYAIDNADMALCLARRLRLPKFLTRLVIRTLTRCFDRIAFGTQGARESYATYDHRLDEKVMTKVIPQLPSRCDCMPERVTDVSGVLFVSALESRKGVTQLMQAWDTIDYENKRLTIIGKGALEKTVSEWASTRSSVSLVVDPPREEIHAALREHHVVVAPSQPQPCWREQVGLPIVEGLAHGCSVVTTSETGLAAWLADHGHVVLEDPQDIAALATAIEREMRTATPADSVLQNLPKSHTRSVADRWLTN